MIVYSSVIYKGLKRLSNRERKNISFQKNKLNIIKNKYIYINYILNNQYNSKVKPKIL